MKIEHITDNPQYLEMVSKWIYKEFIENIRQDIDYEFVLTAFSNRKKDAIPMTLIAIEDDECLGTITLFANDLKNRMDLTPWLGALYVNENHRKKGVAKKLIEELMLKTEELGFETIYLRTEHASNYYLKLGWEFLFKANDELGLETEVFSKKIDV